MILTGLWEVMPGSALAERVSWQQKREPPVAFLTFITAIRWELGGIRLHPFEADGSF